MTISVNHTRAEAMLCDAWNQTIDARVQPPAPIRKLIEATMQATDVTYKYILVTGLLGKCADPRVHPRVLQAGSSLRESYDARSLCHSVIVPFEHEHGDLFGLSNEPFLNKPARHPEHDKNNLQLKNKSLARNVHDALEWAHSAPMGEVFAALVHTLRLAKERAANKTEAAIATKANLRGTIEFVREFLQDADGGARLAAIWGAFTSLLEENARVDVGLPTRSDSFAGASGDVEVFVEDELVSAAECKHRPLTADDIKHGIKKATERGTPQYLFVIAAGIAGGQQDNVRVAIQEAAQKLDTDIIDIFEVTPLLAKLLGPHRRAVFGERVVEILGGMHRSEAANTAAEIWNRLQT